jgi:diacylglycerol kinase family enzyme
MQWNLAEATFQVDTPVAYHLDGEPMGTESTFTITLKPRELGVLYSGLEL